MNRCEGIYLDITWAMRTSYTYFMNFFSFISNFLSSELLYPETVAKRCSVRKVFLQIPQNSQENAFARVYNIHNMNILNVISVFRLPFLWLCFFWNRISVSKLLHYSYSEPDDRKFLYLFIKYLLISLLLF